MTIIKNYRMPQNCYDCDLHNYHECDLTCESIEEDYCWNGDSREKHCPLREVEAIPLPQDATNEDILKAVFPKDAEDIIKYIKAAILNGWLNSKYEGLEYGKID